jgi:uncharacterized protein (UPF0332 family)
MHQKFEWTLYLDLAKELLVLTSLEQELNTNENIKEAHYRTIISRAYYAAFCTARNYLRDTLNIRISKVDAHAFVIIEFKEQRKLRNSHNISNTLHSLRNYRNMADYDDICKVRLDHVAQHAVKESQRIIDLISALS